MVVARPKKNPAVVQYWLPDPEDLDRLLQLLEICGYTDKCLAREESIELNASGTIFEVTVTRRETGDSVPGVWQEDMDWIEGQHPTVCQA